MIYNLFPTPLDANGNPLIGFGTQIYTERFTAIDTDGSALTISDFPDWKGGFIHVEGATAVAYFTGDHAAAEEIHLTSDGVTLELPKAGVAGETIGSVAAPSGTVNVSVLLWR